MGITKTLHCSIARLYIKTMEKAILFIFLSSRLLPCSIPKDVVTVLHSTVDADCAQDEEGERGKSHN